MLAGVVIVSTLIGGHKRMFFCPWAFETAVCNGLCYAFTLLDVSILLYMILSLLGRGGEVTG